MGYRVDLPEKRLRVDSTKFSTFTLTPDDVGPSVTKMEGISGESTDIGAEGVKEKRRNALAFHLARCLLLNENEFQDKNGDPKLYLFGQLKGVARRWLDGGYLECVGGTKPWMIADLGIDKRVANLICEAIVSSAIDKEKNKEKKVVRAVLDAYNKTSSTEHVNFLTTKDVWRTDPNKCHVNYVVCDSGWEAEFARIVEQHERVLSYVKNARPGLEIPYNNGAHLRTYLPDFIVRLDDGHGDDDPLYLVIEVKGYPRGDAKLKSKTTRERWVPGVNTLGEFGRWVFGEFSNVFTFEKEFNALVERVINEQNKALSKLAEVA